MAVHRPRRSGSLPQRASEVVPPARQRFRPVRQPARAEHALRPAQGPAVPPSPRPREPVRHAAQPKKCVTLRTSRATNAGAARPHAPLSRAPPRSHMHAHLPEPRAFAPRRERTRGEPSLFYGGSCAVDHKLSPHLSRSSRGVSSAHKNLAPTALRKVFQAGPQPRARD